VAKVKIKLNSQYFSEGKYYQAGEVVEVPKAWLDKNPSVGEVVTGDEKPAAQVAPPDAPPELADEPGVVFSPPLSPAPKAKRGRKAKAKG
jgi:hypothetical protein